MKIYFDVCALGRLTDDQSQQRIQNEALAVEAALRLVRLGVHEWVISPFIEDEVWMNPDKERRQDALNLISSATRYQELTQTVVANAATYEGFGLGLYDALHLAAAVEAGCGALLTTDDRFIRAAMRIPGIPAVFVRNPVDL